MDLLYFITPAHQRYEMSEICFAQRRWLIDQLAERGIEAQGVVVANDDNLALAKTYGLDTVVRDNQWLGRRFNDGYQHAVEKGATHTFAVGSDEWPHPDLFKTLPGPMELTRSPYYTLYHRNGKKRADLNIQHRVGARYTLSTDLLKRVNNRPCDDYISRRCDTTTFDNVTYEQNVVITHSIPPKYAFVAFQSPHPHEQISSYDKLCKAYFCKEVYEEIFRPLWGYYPDNLVERIVAYYGGSDV